MTKQIWLHFYKQCIWGVMTPKIYNHISLVQSVVRFSSPFMIKEPNRVSFSFFYFC
ncbi:hypothetical protein Hdeb2414_s0036g00731631 [Helianthus debilis subsp. tardiflorus]